MKKHDTLARLGHYVGQRKKRFVLLGALLGLWCLRDVLLTAIVRRQLRAVPQVDIGFSSLHLSVLPGALSVRDLSIDQRPMPEAGGLAANGLPLARVDQAVFSWRYGALFGRSVAGSADLTGVTATLWRVETKRRKQGKDSGKGAAQNPQERVTQAEIVPDPPPPETISAAWPEIARLALPISVDSVEVHDAKLIWHDTTVKPPLDFDVGGIALSANNLTNREGLADGQYGRVTASADPSGGHLHLTMEVDPLAKSPTFALRGDLQGLQLPEANRVLLSYAKLDTESGALSAKFAFKCERGHYAGTMEPSLAHLKVRGESQSEEQNTWLNRLYRKTTQAVGSLLKDNASDTIASRIPLSGEFADPEIGVAAAVGSLLSNAFWQAITPGEQGSALGHLRPKPQQGSGNAAAPKAAAAKPGQGGAKPANKPAAKARHGR